MTLTEKDKAATGLSAYRCDCGRLLGLYENGAQCHGYIQQCHRCKKKVEINIEPQEGQEHGKNYNIGI